MNPLEITTLVNTAANLAAVCLNDGELSVAAAAFTQLGDTLATIAALRNAKSNDSENCGSPCGENNECEEPEQ